MIFFLALKRENDIYFILESGLSDDILITPLIYSLPIASFSSLLILSNNILTSSAMPKILEVKYLSVTVPHNQQPPWITYKKKIKLTLFPHSVAW